MNLDDMVGSRLDWLTDSVTIFPPVSLFSRGPFSTMLFDLKGTLGTSPPVLTASRKTKSAVCPSDKVKSETMPGPLCRGQLVVSSWKSMSASGIPLQAPVSSLQPDKARNSIVIRSDLNTAFLRYFPLGSFSALVSSSSVVVCACLA